MNVLVACEYSGVVRDAFVARGHNAWSCDLLPSERESSGPHFQQSVLDVLPLEWDMIIAHPPCTHLSASGARWWGSKVIEQREAITFFMEFTRQPCRWAIENPIGLMSRAYRKPDQIIQPWQFGHGETKATCLWLNGLPPLQPTDVVDGREARVHRMPPGPNRWKERSRTFQGIANAMAAQWGSL